MLMIYFTGFEIYNKNNGCGDFSLVINKMFKILYKYIHDIHTL